MIFLFNFLKQMFKKKFCFLPFLLLEFQIARGTDFTHHQANPYAGTHIYIEEQIEATKGIHANYFIG